MAVALLSAACPARDHGGLMSSVLYFLISSPSKSFVNLLNLWVL